MFSKYDYHIYPFCHVMTREELTKGPCKQPIHDMAKQSTQPFSNNKHLHAHLPPEHPVAKSSEDFEEPSEETSQVMALTHDL
jgi:hypothetical protein